MTNGKLKFSPDQKEWHQTLANVFATVLKIKIKPVLVYDRKHFAGLTRKGKYKANQVWAECIRETGTIWLSKNLANATKIEIVNTIIHELTHIKHPEWNEKQVTDYANKLATCLPDLDSLKLAKDNVYEKQYRNNKKPHRKPRKT